MLVVVEWLVIEMGEKYLHVLIKNLRFPLHDLEQCEERGFGGEFPGDDDVAAGGENWRCE